MKKLFSNPNRLIKQLALLTVIILVIEYVTGMYVNLFVELPEGQSGWAELPEHLSMMFHVYVMTFLVLSSLPIVIIAIKNKFRKVTVLSIFGIVCIGLAAIFGSSFLNKESEINSLLMAVSFLGAIVAYLKITFLEGKIQG